VEVKPATILQIDHSQYPICDDQPLVAASRYNSVMDSVVYRCPHDGSERAGLVCGRAGG
jgi:hypothetical protein